MQNWNSFPLDEYSKGRTAAVIYSYLPCFAQRARAAYLQEVTQAMAWRGGGGQIDFLLKLGKWAAIKHVIRSLLLLSSIKVVEMGYS